MNLEFSPIPIFEFLFELFPNPTPWLEVISKLISFLFSIFNPFWFIINSCFLLLISFFLFSWSSSSSSTSLTPYKSIEIFSNLFKVGVFTIFWFLFISFNLTFSNFFLPPPKLPFPANFWALIPIVFNLLNLLTLIWLFIAIEGRNISLFWTSIFKLSIFFCKFLASSSKSIFLSFNTFIKLFKSKFFWVNSWIFWSLPFFSLDNVWFILSISII